MRAIKMPEPPGQGGRAKQLNTNYKPLYFTKKPYQQSILPEIKSWAVDLLAERYFQGADSLQHRHASLFWMRSGGRLQNV